MTTPARIRVIVVDDQMLVRQGLITLLEEAETIDVVGNAADGQTAIALVDEVEPDVVLMDLHMPVMDGTTAAREIRSSHPDTRILALTTFADDDTVFGALQAGAIGYLTKDTALDALISAIHAAADGHAVLDREVQARLLTAAIDSPPPRAPLAGLPDGLTGREAEVLTLMADGHTNAQIAQQLFITEATVKTHVNNLFAKTRLRNRAQAGAYVYRHGLGR